jgi:alpha-L-arabinofuranosidase
MTDGTPTAVTVAPDPQFTAAGQSLPALDTLASRQADGTLQISVVNRDPSQTVSSEIPIAGRHGGAA